MSLNSAPYGSELKEKTTSNWSRFNGSSVWSHLFSTESQKNDLVKGLNQRSGDEAPERL